MSTPRIEKMNVGTIYWRIVLKDDNKSYTTVAPFYSEAEAKAYLATL